MRKRIKLYLNTSCCEISVNVQLVKSHFWQIDPYKHTSVLSTSKATQKFQNSVNNMCTVTIKLTAPSKLVPFTCENNSWRLYPELPPSLVQAPSAIACYGPHLLFFSGYELIEPPKNMCSSHLVCHPSCSMHNAEKSFTFCLRLLYT